MEFLSHECPQLLPKYRGLFPGAYAPAAVKTPVVEAVGELKRRYGVGDRRAWRGGAPPPAPPAPFCAPAFPPRPPPPTPHFFFFFFPPPVFSLPPRLPPPRA